MKIVFWILFWFLYFPLVRLLVFFFFWHPKIYNRCKFEKRNKFEWYSHSYSEIGEKADICLEFSSEGEYQQVAPLIEDALKSGKKLELVFFSPSVEKTIMKLVHFYPNQIRYLRYPFLRIFPFIQRRSFSHWVTADKLIMVRYDLFPEFLLWSMNKNHSLKMIWMTFKKERFKGKRPSWWKRHFLKNADSIIYAGLPDYEMGRNFGFPGKVFDFRSEQIKRRIEKKDEKMQTHFSIYQKFKTLHADHERSLLFGNVWPSDLFLLSQLPKDVLVVVIPHQLSEKNLTQFKEDLKKMGRDVFELNHSTERLGESSTLLINMKGILCELYADFHFAYVGGGFEGSIHSVLEPLVAGSGRISCGPSHHRSTEFDIAHGYDMISEVNTPEQFLQWFNSHENKLSHDRMNKLMTNYLEMREIVISC
jgi:3-deoxy-D-manno-octulosonic-acid transferase